jgi:coproporphyrinogen III oxidase-like Fe-S oxidoreductase
MAKRSSRTGGTRGRRVESVEERLALIEKLMSKLERVYISDVNFIRSPETEMLDAHGVRERWKRFLEGSGKALHRTGHYFNIYLHVPFCPRKCTFCIYPSRKPSGRKAVRRFVESAIAEMEFFAEVFGNVAFLNFYAGGGTPSLLEPGDLEELIRGLRRLYRFETGGMWVIECLPHHVTPERALEFRKLGFTKVSFGVQSLDENVLRLGHRYYQPPSRIVETVERTSTMEGLSVNVDLMMGLAGDDGETFLRSLDLVAGARPHYITISMFQPPRPYVRKHFGGRFEAYGADLRERYRLARERMIEIGERHGYDIDSRADSTQGWQFIRRGLTMDHDYRRPYEVNALGEVPSSCFGVGEYARSHLQGAGVVEHGPHAADPFDPSRKTYTYASLDLRDEMIRHIFFHIYKSGSLSTQRFRRLFGRSIEKDFGHVLRELEALGMIERKGENLVFASSDVRKLFVASRLFLDRRTLLASLQGVDRALLRVSAGGETFHFLVGHPHPGGLHAAERSGYALFAVDEEGREIDALSRGPMMRVLAGLLAKLFAPLVDRHPSATAEELAGALCRLLGAAARRGGLPVSWDLRAVPCDAASGVPHEAPGTEHP